MHANFDVRLRRREREVEMVGHDRIRMEFPCQRLAHPEDCLKEDGLGAVRLEDGLSKLRSVIDVI